MSDNRTADEIKSLITSQYEQGNVVFNTVDGLTFCKIDDFIKQPIDGILYDLNRDEATILTFIDDPKWVNDLAACKVIRKLSQQTASLREENEKLHGIYNSAVEGRADFREAYRKSREECNRLQEEVERVKGDVKRIAVDFFYWWHNQPGTNTEQGFDKYIETERFKALSSKESKPS